jgi:hypothetical protein
MLVRGGGFADGGIWAGRVGCDGWNGRLGGGWNVPGWLLGGTWTGRLTGGGGCWNVPG